MIKLYLTASSIRPSYFSTLRTMLQLNTKLIKSIFENIDSSRKEHERFSKLAAKKRIELLSEINRQLKIREALSKLLKAC